VCMGGFISLHIEKNMRNRILFLVVFLVVTMITHVSLFFIFLFVMSCCVMFVKLCLVSCVIVVVFTCNNLHPKTCWCNKSDVDTV
jgi:hypothetical protein